MIKDKANVEDMVAYFTDKNIPADDLTLVKLAEPDFVCKEFNFYENEVSYQEFGWANDKFVSNIETYFNTKEIDGKCQFE
jgi:predicted adenine nucleotide alpha hydrolase (AANH) superfamily ATPase